MSFKALGISKKLQENIGYSEPFPIQSEAIPLVLARKNIEGIAKTGSGKTAAYILPIVELINSNSLANNTQLKVLILVPTRELALQVLEVSSLFCENLNRPIKSLAVFGGVPLNQQMVQLKNTEILIATPGRLLDLISTQSVSLKKIEILVLDEADKMLNVGFKDEMLDIFKLLPPKRQNLLLSATLDPRLTAIKEVFQCEFIAVRIEEEIDLHSIHQVAYRLEAENKGPFLRELLIKLGNEKVLIFVSSIRTADNVVTKLNKNGFAAEAMHSKKSQSARTNALKKFKGSGLNILVATDLASRGIDLEQLPYVINYELPRSPLDYIHRIGRTGRALAKGEAISLIGPDEEHHFRIIQKKMKIRVEFSEI